MKKSTKAISLLMSALCAFSTFAGCFGGGGSGGGGGGGGPIKVDEKTIVVKVRKAGFGTDWLYELKGKFEAAYAEEGYKVYIPTPDNAIKDGTLINELYYGYEQTGVDLYISSGAGPDAVGALGDYGVLVEELDELVYNQPAINYDGTNETENVIDKISEDVMPFMTDSFGKVYCFNWAQSSGGLAVNTRKLQEYGLTMPKTTNEMFDCFQKIYLGHNGKQNSALDGTYPITYVPGGNGYGLVFLYTMLAQYDRAYFDTFWSFQREGENGQLETLTDAECQNIYDHPAMKEMLTVAFHAFDANLAAPGSLNQGVDQAQAKVMGDIDDAVFMFNGDWMLNEVKLNYPTKLHDIDFMNFPVVSALGTKLFGSTTSYNLDDAACDELLSYIIGLVDENKSLDEIITAVQTNKGITLAEADARTVAEARGVTYSRGVEHLAYITKGSTKKDIAALFLRMMASDDFAETFLRTANGNSPYCQLENTASTYQFVRSASKVASNRYFSLISTFGVVSGYRQQLNLTAFFRTQGHIPDYIASTSTASIYTMDGTLNGKTVAEYVQAAANLISAETQNLKGNWGTIKESAGK